MLVRLVVIKISRKDGRIIMALEDGLEDEGDPGMNELLGNRSECYRAASIAQNGEILILHEVESFKSDPREGMLPYIGGVE